jgi:hypothetical protein
MLNAFLSGAICMCCLTVALFFIRFWNTTRDRLFLFFASAFVILMLERAVRELMEIKSEWEPYVYLFRLGAFLLIIVAIVDKNRRAVR